MAYQMEDDSSSRRAEIIIARDGVKIFSPLGSGKATSEWLMPFLMISTTYKHFRSAGSTGAITSYAVVIDIACQV